MLQRPDGSERIDAIKPKGTRTAMVVAGPGSSLTIPGIIVSQIVQAVAQIAPVTRIEVDLGSDHMAGLHRAPSLAAAHDVTKNHHTARLRAPNNVRFRAQAFREWIGIDTRTAVAYAWPGMDNRWIKQFLQVAQLSGASTIVVCQSRPNSSRSKLLSLVDVVHQAGAVIVGDADDAQQLSLNLGASGPTVQTHRALSLGGRSSRKAVHQITAFLPKNNAGMLANLLAAFDGISDAWVANLRLQVVMRYTGRVIPDLVERSYHAEHVRLVGEDISSIDLEQLCATSSALIVADPALDSRAFSTAVDSGVATVVLATLEPPKVGRGYVGGLLADHDRPASINVALSHALRLADLRFPDPQAWVELAQRLCAGSIDERLVGAYEPATKTG
ncbi:MAG: hypothetical protein ABSC34_00490 [Acidimicrobiales bacterium]